MGLRDHEDVTVSLFNRIVELSKFTKLRRLDLFVQPDTYKQIQAAKFIEHLPALQVMTFCGNDGLTGKEIVAHNELPSGWDGVDAQSYAIFARMP